MTARRNGSRIQSAIRKTLRAELAAVRALGPVVDDRMVDAVDALAGAEAGIFVTGLGKSSYVAMKMAASLVSFGVRAQYLHPVEALHGDSGTLGQGCALVAFSYSGETAEVVRIAKYAQSRMGVSVIAVTGSPASSLARLADHHLRLQIADEGSPENVAPMASVTASLVVADLLTAGLLSLVPFDPHQFARYHPGGSLGLALRRVDTVMADGALVPLVDTHAPLKKALKVMSDKRLGIVGVTDARGALKGVITDGDVRRFLMRGVREGSETAGSVMSARPKSVPPEASLREALALMEKHKITALFVLDAAKKPVGLLHIHHILEHRV